MLSFAYRLVTFYTESKTFRSLDCPETPSGTPGMNKNPDVHRLLPPPFVKALQPDSECLTRTQPDAGTGRSHAD